MSSDGDLGPVPTHLTHPSSSFPSQPFAFFPEFLSFTPNRKHLLYVCEYTPRWYPLFLFLFLLLLLSPFFLSITSFYFCTVLIEFYMTSVDMSEEARIEGVKLIKQMVANELAKRYGSQKVGVVLVGGLFFDLLSSFSSLPLDLSWIYLSTSISIVPLRHSLISYQC